MNAQHKENNVKEYYSYIHKSNTCVVDKQYKQASDYYKKAFLLKYPNGNDLYNAFLCAYYTMDSVLAKKYFNHLAYKGLKKDVFKDTILQAAFYSYVSSQYDSFYNAGSRDVVAQRWRLFADSIRKNDQEIRLRSTIEEGGQLTEDEYNMIMGKVDSVNVERVKNYILKYGFPNFEHKGYWDDSSPLEYDVLWLVLWHQRPYKTDIDNLIYKAVYDGNYPANDWAVILGAREDEQEHKLNMNIWLLPDKLSEKEEQAINNARAALYIEPIMDFKRKWKFAQQNYERERTEYNTYLFSANESVREQFAFYSRFLLPSKQEIEFGYKLFNLPGE